MADEEKREEEIARELEEARKSYRPSELLLEKIKKAKELLKDEGPGLLQQQPQTSPSSEQSSTQPASEPELNTMFIRAEKLYEEKKYIAAAKLYEELAKNEPLDYNKAVAFKGAAESWVQAGKASKAKKNYLDAAKIFKKVADEPQEKICRQEAEKLDRPIGPILKGMETMAGLPSYSQPTQRRRTRGGEANAGGAPSSGGGGTAGAGAAHLDPEIQRELSERLAAAGGAPPEEPLDATIGRIFTRHEPPPHGGGGGPGAGGAGAGAEEGGEGEFRAKIATPGNGHVFDVGQEPFFECRAIGGVGPYTFFLYSDRQEQPYTSPPTGPMFKFKPEEFASGEHKITLFVYDSSKQQGVPDQITITNNIDRGNLDFVIEVPQNKQQFSLLTKSIKSRIRVINPRNVQYELGIYRPRPGLPEGDVIATKTVASKEFFAGNYFDVELLTENLKEGSHVLRYVLHESGKDPRKPVSKTIIIDVGHTVGPTELFEDKKVETEHKGAGPKSFWRVGKGPEDFGVKTGAYGQKYTAMPGLRYSIIAAKNELRRIARRRGNELVQQQISLINQEVERLKKFRAERKMLERERNKILEKFKHGDATFAAAFASKKPADFENFASLLGEVMSDKLSEDQASVILSDKIEQIDRAERNIRDQLRKQRRFEQVFEELKNALNTEAKRLASHIIWRWRLEVTHMNRPQTGMEELKSFVGTELDAEVQRLAYFYQATARSRTRRLLGHGSIILENVGEMSQGLGDVYFNIIHNLYAFITGPWVVGALVVILQFYFVWAYIHPYNRLFHYVFPIVAAAVLFVINLSNSKYPMDFLTHIICGAMIGYDAVILITALNIHLFVNVFWLWMIFLILGFLGAFQIYAPGGYNALLPLTVVILLFGYVAMGPYGAYYHQAIDQIKVPLMMAYNSAKMAVENVWLLATNPTEWYARQQMVNVRPERPMDYPKAVEFMMLDALPDAPPADTEFAVVAVIQNMGDLEATEINADVSCDNYCAKCSGTESGCRGPATAVISKQTLMPGEGTRIEIRHILAEKLDDTKIKRTTWTHFATVTVNITYAYETASSLLVEIMNEQEIERRFRKQEKVYRSVVSAVGKIGPAQLSINVGPQPLHAGSKALLLLSISNTRWDGVVRVGDGDNVKIKLPTEIGTNLDCGAVSKAYTCSQTEDGTLCTIAGEHKIEAYKFNQIIPFLCTFDVRGDVSNAVTGLITAELPRYRFTVQKDKDVQIGPPLGIITPGSPTTPGIGGVSTEKTNKIMQIADNYVGCEYGDAKACPVPSVRGNCGSCTMQCASFVQSVYTAANLANPAPVGSGRYICEHAVFKEHTFTDSDKLQSGDVFAIYSAANGLGHAGIYVGRGTISGDCKTFTADNSGKRVFIHASDGHTCPGFSGVKYATIDDLNFKQGDYTFCRHKDVIISEASVTGTDVLKAMEYAKANSVVDRKCNCGQNCANYASWISKYASENGVDPILVLSIMMQESSCTQGAVSSAGCKGLMQICSFSMCSDIGLSENDVIGTGKEENNIKCGVHILKKKYEAYKSASCGSYSDPWDKAIRGYVGCDSGHPNYVEEVKEKYNILKQHAA